MEKNKGSLKNVNYTYSPEWWQWIADNLPPKTEYWISDIDGFHRDREGNVLLLEKKCFNGEPTTHQSFLYQIIHHAMKYTYNDNNQKAPIKLQDGTTIYIPITYHGYFLLQLSNDLIKNSKLKLNHQAITEEELTYFLNNFKFK